MDEKRIIGGDSNLLAHDAIDGVIDFLAWPAQIDMGRGVVVEHPEAVAQMQVHADAVNAVGQRTRLNANFALVQITFDITVTQPHGGNPQVF
jgi:hypothetical protein